MSAFPANVRALHRNLLLVRSECFQYLLGIAVDGLEQGSGGASGHASALFPVAQGADLYVDDASEADLRQLGFLSDRLDLHRVDVVSETLRLNPDIRVLVWLECHDAELAFGIDKLNPDQRAGRLASGLDERRPRSPARPHLRVHGGGCLDLWRHHGPFVARRP